MAQQVLRGMGLLGVAALAVALAAGPARAQVADDDGDGVANEVDDCPDTPVGNLVDDAGCSMCPCDAPTDANIWESRRAYLTCVTDAAKELLATGRLDRKTRRLVLRSARTSTCGKPDLARCCIYPHFDPAADVNVGRCRIMTGDRCDMLGEKLDTVESLDSGSCYPNPCSF